MARQSRPSEPRSSAAQVHIHGGVPADSELPPCVPPSHLEEVVPRPDGEVGGIDNVAEELVPPAERLQDELDHVGMDLELPGEDRAPVGTDEPQREPSETWGHL